MGKGFGLVGNICIYGISGQVFGWCGYEGYKFTNNQIRYDENHPIQEVYESIQKDRQSSNDTSRGRVFMNNDVLRYGQVELERKKTDVNLNDSDI